MGTIEAGCEDMIKAIRKAPGERTKTDRRDARMLAMALQTGQSPDVVAYADKCRRRLKHKRACLEHNRGKNANVATAAGARELACFVWGMMTGNIV